MKNSFRFLLCGAAMICLFIAACQDVLENVTTTTVSVKESFYTGEANAQPSREILIDSERLIESSGQGLAKPMDVGFIEVPMPVLDLALASVLFASGYWNFDGIIRNEVDDPTIFQFYFSRHTGLSMPHSENFQSSSTFIASFTLPGNAEVSLDTLSYNERREDILRSMAGFFEDLPEGTDMVYAYFVCTNDDEVKVTVVRMDLLLPAAVHIKRAVYPGELAQYRDKIKEVEHGELHGMLTNLSPDTADFSGFVSIVKPGFISGFPAETDSVGYVLIPKEGDPDNVIDLSESPTFLVREGSQRIADSIRALILGDSLEANIFLVNRTSDNFLRVRLDSLALKTEIKVGL
jgi:hypothetical protein